MSVSDLSTSTQNYLKAVWGLSEWSDASRHTDGDRGKDRAEAVVSL